MGVLVVLLVVAACVGGVMWNRRNAAEAMRGVAFAAPHSQDAIARAIAELYCGGAKSAVRSMLSGLSVERTAQGTFRYKSKHGDTGTIRVRATAGGSTVEAAAEKLFVGATHRGRFGRSGVWALSARLTHGIFTLLGLTPNAVKMKRFQNGLEKKIAKRLRGTPHAGPAAGSPGIGEPRQAAMSRDAAG